MIHSTPAFLLFAKKIMFPESFFWGATTVPKTKSWGECQGPTTHPHWPVMAGRGFGGLCTVQEPWAKTFLVLLKKLCFLTNVIKPKIVLRVRSIVTAIEDEHPFTNGPRYCWGFIERTHDGKLSDPDRTRSQRCPTTLLNHYACARRYVKQEHCENGC